MSRDVIMVGSTMRIPLLYRGEYSQWRKRFMNYLKEQTDGEAMTNSIQNGDQPLLVIAQVNETAKDLWDALERQMCGSEYGEQDRKSAIFYEYETFKATKEEQLLDTYLRYLQVINDLKKCGYKKYNCKLNYKFLNNLQPEWRQYEKVVVSSNSEGSGADDFSKLKKITALLENAYNRRKFYSKPINNNLRTSSTSQSAHKKQEFVKSDDKKVLSDSDESFSSAEETIAEVTYYTSESESKSEFKTLEYYDNSTNYGLFVNDDDDQEVFYDAIESASENFVENHIDSQKEYDKSKKRIEKANQQTKYLENQNKDLQDKYDVLINQVNTFEEQNNEFNEQMKVLNEKNVDLLAQTKVLQDQLKVKHVVIDTHTECQAQYAKLEEERYEYMIRYSALCDNDKQHRKNIDKQEILFDKMSRQLVEINDNVLKIQVILKKAKDLRPSLYDEKVIGLRYTLMFLIHSDKALEIEKFKRARENKIEFAYDCGNLNAIYVNEKINFLDDYFQEKINLDFEKIDSPFQQTSSLKPYVLIVILKKIIIDLEDEVVRLLEKEKANLKTIESLKLKVFELSENVISESENQSENDYLVVEKECDQVENSKV
nr:hypothetical protein [Tanacetum cinerariifolium]